jgi:transposase
MIGVEEKKVEKRELRHRVKQTPFRRILRAVEDKAAEVGSVVFYVSSFRNSRVSNPFRLAEKRRRLACAALSAQPRLG